MKQSLNRIIDLRDEPEHIPLLVKWHHQEWSYLNPNKTEADRAEKMKCYLGSEFISSTFIYKYENQLAGSAAIVDADMDTHTELTPWLASVYVNVSFRRRGIGAALVKHVMEEARLHGIKKLFLFTPSKAKFYEHLGWRTLSNEMYRGVSVTIMSVQLSGE